MIFFKRKKMYVLQDKTGNIAKFKTGVIDEFKSVVSDKFKSEVNEEFVHTNCFGDLNITVFETIYCLRTV